MRKRTRRFKLSIILWTLLLVPPVGLYLLWTAPRSRRYKIGLTVAAVLVYAVLAGVVWASGLYDDYVEPPVPASGFCVERNHQGHYRIDRVLPFERQVFLEVVDQKREYEKQTGGLFSETEAGAIDDAESRAIAAVAERNGLDSTDVLAIFMKVSSKMAPSR